MKDFNNPSEYAYFLWWAEPALIKQGTSVRQILDNSLLEGVSKMDFKLGTIGPNVSRLLGFSDPCTTNREGFQPLIHQVTAVNASHPLTEQLVPSSGPQSEQLTIDQPTKLEYWSGNLPAR